MVEKVDEIIGGRYQIIKELGRGGFGQTYLAQDLQEPSHPRCVVKHLQPETSDELVLREAKRLFVIEAKVMAKLGDNPQIPCLFAYYGEEFCLVQEFIDGQDLSKEIRVGQRLSEEKVVEFLKELLPILAFIHNNNVIHRDIKPSNLRRAKDGTLYLIDFGSVKEINTIVLTADGKPKPSIVAGTEGYMPPEQLRGHPRFNSDIYAVGLIAIQALTGKSPTQLEEDPETGRVKWREFVDISEGLTEILETMTHQHFAERYQCAEEVIQELEDLNKPGWTSLKKRIQKKKFRNSWRRWLPGGGAIALVGAGLLLIPLARATYLFNQGNVLVREGKYQEAIAFYDQSLALYEKSEKAFLNRGFALSKLSRFEQQLDSCNRAIDLDPQFVEAINCKGLALDDLGRNEEAISIFEQAIKLDKDFYQAWNNMGEVLMELDRFEQALTAFDTAKLYNPDYLFAWNNRGNALFELERYAEAMAAYDQAIQLDPSYPYAWNGRGNARRKLGRYEAALADYEQAIELQAAFYEAWFNKALTWVALDELEKAIKSLDEAIKIKPDYTVAINYRENLHQKLTINN